MKFNKIFTLPLKYLFIGIASMLALAIIFVCCFGFNTSVEFGGGSQIKIDVTEVVDQSATLKKASAVLSANKLSVENTFVEDNGTQTYLVFRVTDKNIKNTDAIKSELSARCGVSAESIIGFDAVNYTTESSTVLLFGLGFVALIVVVFFAGWARYKLTGALTLTLATFVDFMLYLSIVAVLRIRISSATLISLVSSVVLTTMAIVAVLENVRGSKKLKQYENYSNKDMVVHFAQKEFLPFAVICGVVAVFGVLCLFIPNAYVQTFDFSLIFSAIIALFVSMILGPAFYVYALDVGDSRKQAKLNKNKQKY